MKGSSPGICSPTGLLALSSPSYLESMFATILEAPRERLCRLWCEHLPEFILPQDWPEQEEKKTNICRSSEMLQERMKQGQVGYYLNLSSDIPGPFTKLCAPRPHLICGCIQYLLHQFFSTNCVNSISIQPFWHFHGRVSF